MLGEGVYKLSEVAKFTGLPSSTVRTWFKWRADRHGLGPLFVTDYPAVDDDYAVSFLNLIDAYVAAFFRTQGVRPSLIRRAYAILQKDLHTPHPFAHVDLKTDGERIVRQTANEVRIPELIDVVSKQKWFSQWAKYLSHLDYNPSTKLAGRWNISEGIVIDPQISFGKPVVKSTGVTAFVLANQYQANKRNAALVADLYNVSEADVLNAVRFETHRGILAIAA